MTQLAQAVDVREFRTWTKDIGVAIVVIVALALGFVLRSQVGGQTTTFQDKASGFSIAYPASWGGVASLQGAILDVSDPRTGSVYKTSLSVEKRGLDPQNPPTIQQLVDRRIQQQGALTAFHLLSSQDDTVAGAKAMRQEYAYVVQPIDQALRASVPVVVHAIEYVVVTKDNAFFITLNAPESAFADASAQMNDIIRSVKVQ